MSHPGPFLPERFSPSTHSILTESQLFSAYVYLDGHFVRGAEAGVSVWDHGLLYGDGVFEGIRAYGGRMLLLGEHLDRLYESAHSLAIRIPLMKDEFAEAIRLTFRANACFEGHARALVTRGVGQPGLDPRRAVRPSVMIQVVPMAPLRGSTPIRVLISSVRRKSPHAVDAKIKSLNYLDSILANLQATAAGMDDAIMLDINGWVAEATAENVFVVKAGRLATPTTNAALHGITRQAVIDFARGQSLVVVERNITYHELYTADEIFLTGSAAEIVPVKEVDGRTVGINQPGPITRRVADWYHSYARETGTPI